MRLNYGYNPTDEFKISIHAPVKGATIINIARAIHHCNFNPRTREGCDEIEYNDYVYDIISIHAPVKGATFQHHFNPSYTINFNPRTREGCDMIAEKNPLVNFISIHAPVKGAT